MAFKLVLLLACIAVASAGILAPAASLAGVQVEEHDPHPQYTYGYDVQDTITGDSKNQIENRDGGVVSGQYSLNDADGYRRIVDYTADPINGFNAIVRREPLGVAPVAIAARAPLAYTAGAALVKTSFASPIVSYAY